MFKPSKEAIIEKLLLKEKNTLNKEKKCIT